MGELVLDMTNPTRISQSTSGMVERRTKCHLDAILWYLFNYPTRAAESMEEAGERYVDSVNAFYDQEPFSFSRSAKHSFRIRCECGWGLSIALPWDPLALKDFVPFDKCVKQMVLHYEGQHGGLKPTTLR